MAHRSAEHERARGLCRDYTYDRSVGLSARLGRRRHWRLRVFLNARGEVEEKERKDLLTVREIFPAAVRKAHEFGGRKRRDVSVEVSGLTALLGDGRSG